MYLLSHGAAAVIVCLCGDPGRSGSAQTSALLPPVSRRRASKIIFISWLSVGCSSGDKQEELVKFLLLINSFCW